MFDAAINTIFAGKSENSVASVSPIMWVTCRLVLQPHPLPCPYLHPRPYPHPSPHSMTLGFILFAIENLVKYKSLLH